MDRQQQDAINWTNSQVGNKNSSSSQMQKEQKQLYYRMLDFLDMT